MGSQFSTNKYVLLYGAQDSGKTLMQYYMQSSFKDFSGIKPTEGYNYEEIELENVSLGVFDVSGDPKQYEIVNIVMKCVPISGIIFMVPLDRMEELEKNREMLKLILGNNYITESVALLVIYNYKDQKVKERIIWMTESLLDSRMKLDKIKEEFKLDYVKSYIADVSSLDNSNFTEILESFVKNLEKQN